MKGVYILVTRLREDSKMEIGKLGSIIFKKGLYCYVGSALGKNMNLENRTKRHEMLARDKKGNLKWHIDYFLTNPKVGLDGIIVFNGNKGECKVSRALQGEAEETIRGFGSSDCNKCKGHFHRFGSMKKVLKTVESI
jgi:Uri superfamily endonuclease